MGIQYSPYPKYIIRLIIILPIKIHKTLPHITVGIYNKPITSSTSFTLPTPSYSLTTHNIQYFAFDIIEVMKLQSLVVI